MPMAAMTAYLERIPARQAEWKLMAAEAVSLPHMQQSAGRALTNSWMKEAQVFMPRTSVRVASPGRLKLMGIGVRDGRKQ